METTTFKIQRGKLGPMKQEVINLINHAAKQLDMYDERFPDSEQCGGYYAFRQFCINQDKLVYNSANVHFNMSAFHTNIKHHVIKAVEVVRNLIKTKNYTVWDKENTPS